jgi:hypothetical protein
MESEFRPNLAVAAAKHCPGRFVDVGAPARYIVAIIVGSIMLMGTQRDRRITPRHFDCLKEHQNLALCARGSSARNE